MSYLISRYVGNSLRRMECSGFIQKIVDDAFEKRPLLLGWLTGDNRDV